jgi:hypothetical protein
MMMKKLLLGIGALGLLIGVAIAQVPNLALVSPTGTEQINVLVPSTGTIVTNPQIQTVTINQVRNTTGYQISSATTGTIVTTTATDNLLLTGAVTTATIDVPPSPPDGALFSITNATTSNFSGTITIASTDSSSFIPTSPSISNLAQQTGQEWQYVKSSTTWYRVR